MMRYAALPWPWAALIVVAALLGQEWLLRFIGAGPSLAETAYRMSIATLGSVALALILLPRRRAAYVLGALVCMGCGCSTVWASSRARCAYSSASL
jgi:hypothetical protein